MMGGLVRRLEIERFVLRPRRNPRPFQMPQYLRAHTRAISHPAIFGRWSGCPCLPALVRASGHAILKRARCQGSRPIPSMRVTTYLPSRRPGVRADEAPSDARAAASQGAVRRCVTSSKPLVIFTSIPVSDEPYAMRPASGAHTGVVSSNAPKVKRPDVPARRSNVHTSSIRRLWIGDVRRQAAAHPATTTGCRSSPAHQRPPAPFPLGHTM